MNRELALPLNEDDGSVVLSRCEITLLPLLATTAACLEFCSNQRATFSFHTDLLRTKEGRKGN